jgi:hypothetical protein
LPAPAVRCVGSWTGVDISAGCKSAEDLTVAEFRALAFDGVECFSGLGHDDARGRLTVFEYGSNLPFPLRRVYLLSDSNASTVRGAHSVSCDRVVQVIVGAVSIDLDNGTQKASLRLGDPRAMLRITPGIWMRLRQFAPNTVVVVCASELYKDTQTFGLPRPGISSESH